MRKTLLLFVLLVAFQFAKAQFVPTTGAYYTINATQSGVYSAVGPNLSVFALPVAQAALTPVRNDGTQAFTFIPVSDGLGGFKANTYYLQNKWGKYLNNSPANAWDAALVDTVNGAKSEWVISGANPSVKLHSNGGAAATKYLAPAANRVFEFMYCDKTSNNTFSINAYTVVTSPTVSLSAKAFQIEAGETYYVSVASVDNSVSSSVTVEAPAGITVSKTAISQADFAAGNSTVNIGISSTATPGSTSTINIKDGSTTIATILVKTVASFTRYYMTEQSSSLVLGTTAATDSLDKILTNSGSIYQKFYLRKLNVSDVSTPDTVQIVQNSTYRNLRPGYASNASYPIFSQWDTQLGLIPGLYSTWIRTDGIGYSQFANTIYSGSKYFGGVTAATNRPVYDKTAVFAGTKWVMTPSDLPSISSNISSILFDSNQPSRSFIVTGTNLAADVTLTAPDGITLSQTTITLAEALAGKTVTATWDGTTSVSGSVSLSSTTASASVSLGLFGLKFGQKYYIKEPLTGLYFTESGDVNNRAFISDSIGSDAQKFMVIGTNYPEEYLLKNSATGYLAKSAANNYDTYFFNDTTTTSAGYRFKLTKNLDGSYILKNTLVTGSLGTDATTNGAFVYNDKSAGSVRNWIFAEVPSFTTKLSETSNTDIFATVSNKTVSVQGIAAGAQVNVYNVNGQKVTSAVASDDKVKISLASGIYLIKVQSQHAVSTIKVVVE